MMPSTTRYMLIAFVLTLTACQRATAPDPASPDNTAVGPASPPAAAPGLSADEQEGIKRGLINDLSRLAYDSFATGTHVACTSMFDLGPPRIEDAMLSGSSGKVRVAVPITASRPLDRGTGSTPRYYFLSDACYGAPRGDWQIGQTSNSTYDVIVERWSSGWRMAPGQQLNPTG